MAKKTNNMVTKDARVTAPCQLWEDFQTAMKRKGCLTLAEQFRECMRLIVRNEIGNGVSHGNYTRI